MISQRPPCFPTLGAPPGSRTAPWTPADFQPHPHRLHARKLPPQRMPLERVEPATPDLAPPRPLNELASALVRRFDDCIGQVGQASLLQRQDLVGLKQALSSAREMAGNWVRLCNRLTMGSPQAVDNAGKVLACLHKLLDQVRDCANALPGFSNAGPDLLAALAAVDQLRAQLQALPDYLASVWPDDGSWDRQPPTLGHVLMLLQTTTHAELVKARLEDGQAPLGIASEPSSASTRDVERLQQQLARALRNPDLALPLSEAVILLASPPVPVDTVVRGLRCGLSATETRAMFQAGVPIHPQTVPDAALRQQLAALKPVPTQQVGKGAVNQVHLLSWASDSTTLCFTWRPEHPDAQADAMGDCDIPMRGSTQWHLPGPHLTGRQVLSHRLGERLPMACNGVMVTPAWPAVIDGVYGSLNAYVPGLQKLLVNSPCNMPLDPQDLQWLRDWADTPDLLADIARQQGLTRLTLTETGLCAEASLPQHGGSVFHRPLVHPLATDNPRIRQQMVTAVWLHQLTGQVDWNAGNLAFVADPADPERPVLVLFDNDLAFGRALMHPEDALNNQRQQKPGPRVRAPWSPLHGTRLPDVIPADLAEALLGLNDRQMLACGAAGLITLPEFRALQSRLRHIQQHVRQLRDQGGWLRTEADWLAAETTQRLGLHDLPGQAEAVASDTPQPPGVKIDAERLREIESGSLMRALAVGQTVARRHPAQDHFPVVLDTDAVVQAVRHARGQAQFMKT